MRARRLAPLPALAFALAACGQAELSPVNGAAPASFAALPQTPPPLLPTTPEIAVAAPPLQETAPATGDLEDQAFAPPDPDVPANAQEIDPPPDEPIEAEPEHLEDQAEDDDNNPPIDPEPRDEHEIASVAKETWIFAEPRWTSRKLGYLRAGSIVKREPKPKGFRSCKEGWYGIHPTGFVCAGAGATLDIHDPVVETSSKRPSMSGLPYTYVMSRNPPPPLYIRLPSPAEQRRVEPDLPSHLRKTSLTSLDQSFVAPPPPDPTPGVLLYDRPAPGLRGPFRSPDALFLGTARPRSAYALLSTFDHEGRRFGLTTELEVIPIDRTRVVRQSSFAGLTLTGESSLPVAFVRSRRAVRYVPGPHGGLVAGDPLPFRAAVPLASNFVGPQTIGGAQLLAAKDGSFLRADQVVKVSRPKRLPAWASAGRKWIDVSILNQTLVAYEGEKPVYVTLVSTGADGLGDPKKTHSTIQGAFLIHTKHVTVTMDGDDDDQFDFRDVPFVQYFTEGFALHAAYWHDDFGTPRSHGCVNLAPIDAAWLFAWTTPEVPPAWHAALSLKKGTLVYIHP
ncbi:MAG: L,D-transpeptidase [Polyangiaceae bacterium]|nr:L,D-transpeptidase [Polyangiaceae bacterium]